MKLVEIFKKSEKYQKVLNIIRKKSNAAVSGLQESEKRYFTASLSDKILKPQLVVTMNNAQAVKTYEDLVHFLPQDKVFLFPACEAYPFEELRPEPETMLERIKTLSSLAENESNNCLVVASIESLLQRIIPPDIMREYTYKIACDDIVDLKELRSTFVAQGYERVDRVENYAQFSIRGGIVDIFPLHLDSPIRIDLFDDQVDSIRFFDIETQRSNRELSKVKILPAREFILPPSIISEGIGRIRNSLEDLSKSDLDSYQDTEKKVEEAVERFSQDIYFSESNEYMPFFYPEKTLFDYESFSVVFWDQADRVGGRLEQLEKDFQEEVARRLEEGNYLPEVFDINISSAQLMHYLTEVPAVYLSLYQQLSGKDYGLENPVEWVDFTTLEMENFQGNFIELGKKLKELQSEKYKVVVLIDDRKQIERLNNYLREEDIQSSLIRELDGHLQPGNILLSQGRLDSGFIFADLRLAVFTGREILDEKKRSTRYRKFDDGEKISTFEDLDPGDYVVHINHGIGKYKGVKCLEVDNIESDYLIIEYADDDKLYVPIEQVDLVQKYIGGGGSNGQNPKLYKLGGNRWERVKQRVKESVRDMADELLKLYAAREMTEGYSFSEDTVWQKEFEDAFSYEETPDQMKAIEDVKEDMESYQPMDRLLCGDVGYGKTEVAIRAAFKSVMDSKQVAVLVPTTILAQQHFATFSSRFKGYPMKIEVISRFKSAGEQKKIIKNLENGTVDIVIGTHRLLQKDIDFNDLGLVVIDEEQRFGVAHKEYLKQLRKNVDVITLTATPIPRTLHMSLVGVRDMSVIETPPENRFPIRTYVREYSSSLIREGIEREIDRQGQVYFVHNRVESIDAVASNIKRLVPDARVGIAHGQMQEERLENIMLDFLDGLYDVLVCTTIIESGLDISNVNTIFINNADHLGLAQLYQLRGRVGRTDRVAYAYLLYQKDKVLSEIAQKRLKAIRDFTRLGSGFKIAMRDLEIRGAGNILGPEQHGHIAAVGFSLYVRLLEDAVKELKGEGSKKEPETEVDISINAYIDDNYISDSSQKIEIYKKIAGCKEQEDLEEIREELEDRFGKLTQNVNNLIEMTEIKLKAAECEIYEIEEHDNEIHFILNSRTKFTEEIIKTLQKDKPLITRLRFKADPDPVLKFNTYNISSAQILKLIKRLLSVICQKDEYSFAHQPG